jgi:hypothetical protein
VTYISECSAPDLSDIRTPVLANYTLNISLAGGGTSDRKAGSFVINCILTIDKAIREYNAGRGLLVQYVASANRTTLLIESLGRFETCINSAKRALRHVDRLARHAGGPDVERAVRRLLDSYGKAITPVRDAIEHMDDAVSAERLADGEPHTLAISRDSKYLEIAGHRLAFNRLAQLLRHLHGLAEELARFNERSVGLPDT